MRIRPVAPHLWELGVGFIQGVGAGVHGMGQFLLQKTVDCGCIANPKSKNKANEQKLFLDIADFPEA